MRIKRRISGTSDIGTGLSLTVLEAVAPKARAKWGAFSPVEALEERRLLSLTVTLREADGASSATVTSVGQVVDLHLFATITSASNLPSEDELQDVAGELFSSAVDQHAVAGDLAGINIAPFNGVGAQPGSQNDFTGDGNLDIGAYNGFAAVASTPQGEQAGTVVDNGTALQFDVGEITYTVTHLGQGGATDINFTNSPVAVLDDSNGGLFNAAWFEQSTAASPTTSTFQVGTPFVVSDPALVTAPQAVNDTAKVSINTRTILNALYNADIIAPLNLASLKVVTSATHGTATVNSDGTITYTPSQHYLGPDSFSYTVADNAGRISNPAKVSIDVVSAAVPVISTQNLTLNVYNDEQLRINATVTPPATPTGSQIALVQAPVDGSIDIQPDGTIDYNAGNMGFEGTDSFAYTVTDSAGQTSNPGIVNVLFNKTLPNANGVARNDSGTTTVNTPVLLDVRSNDGFIEPTTNVQITLSPAHGTTVVQPDNTVLYTPDPGYTGTDSFDYDIGGNQQLPPAFDYIYSNPAMVSITIKPAGAVTSSDTEFVPAGQSTSINVLPAVTSGSPQTSSIAVLVSPTHGAAVVDDVSGTVTYTPSASFVGTDTFEYTVTIQDAAQSNLGTVTVDVGADLSSAKGATHSLTFVNAAGAAQSISIAGGMAQVSFTGGNGSIKYYRSGRATISGAKLNIGKIALTGTSLRSSLSISRSARSTVNVGDVTDPAPLGSFVAPSADLIGMLSLDSIGSIKVNSISCPTFAASIGLISAKTIAMATITTSGNIGALIAGSIEGSTVTAGVATATTLANANPSSLGTATIGSIRLTGKTGVQFSQSTILAGRIALMSLGHVDTADDATPDGVAANAIGSFFGTFGRKPLRASRSQLTNESVLNAYVTRRGVVFGNFEIQIAE